MVDLDIRKLKKCRDRWIGCQTKGHTLPNPPSPLNYFRTTFSEPHFCFKTHLQTTNSPLYNDYLFEQL